MRVPIITFIAFAIMASAAGAQAPAERYVVVANGERVGHLHVTRNGPRVNTDFLIDDNGRGPKIRETWRLGTDGLPRQLTLSGSSTFRSPVKESFGWRGNRAEWQSLNDRGSTAATRPAAYIPIDGSPYFLALYLPALLAAPERTLPAWPGGSLRAERVRGRAHVGARAELDAIADEVVQVVRLMDGLNRYRFANQPESLATWGSASNTFGPVRKAVDTAAVDKAAVDTAAVNNAA